ncbi:MAG: hypothetical protein GEU80_13190 [Dehalococcoidia bacterium]|nr:hypothetical protein [Dehalococcoidia bacterium]
MTSGAEPFPIWRVFTGEDGQTHVESIGVPMEPQGAPGRALSRLLTGTGVILRRTPADLDVDWHPAPRRQFVVTLSGRGEIETSDGTVLPVEPGMVVLVDDIDGIGHRTRAVGDEERLSLFIPIDDDVRFD